MRTTPIRALAENLSVRWEDRGEMQVSSSSMYKIVAFTKFKAGMEPGAAREYWRDVHGPMALKVPTIRRYFQDHWMEPLAGGALEFDGNSEIWYDDEAGYEATMERDDWKTLVDDGPNCFDYSSMVSGIVEETVLRRPAAGADVKTLWTVRFRDDVSREEARRHWLDSNGPLALEVPGLVGLAQNHGVKAADNEGLRDSLPFEGRVDGFFLAWFEDRAALDSALGSPQWKAMRDDAEAFVADGGLRGVLLTEYVKRSGAEA
jgi:uncharacterized protein (TIGR02118 family)